MWLITNKSIEKKNKDFQYLILNDFSISSKQLVLNSEQDQTQWLIDGYILPRENVIENCNSNNPLKLLDSLLSIYGDNFIYYIKGNFILIQIDQSGFKIYSDTFAIKKFFIYQKGKDFIISRNLKEISNRTKLEPSKDNMACYSLTYHFTGGRTAFKDVRHNLPGEYLMYNGQEILIKSYWEPRELLTKSRNEISVAQLSAKLKDFISFTLPLNDDVSLSLTGGGDTRNLLSLFLSLGIKPHLYTYGNPLSNDCIKARVIAESLKLNHSVHNIKIVSETFELYARKIIRLEGGLASIHRVHRLMAIEMEKEFAAFMYLGSLGGEFIKGIDNDDYIIPSIVYVNWNKTGLSQNELEVYLKLKRLIVNGTPLINLLTLLNTEPFMQGDIITRKLNTLSYITAHLHDAQDINLYQSVMHNVYTPFLDIDYLETLFSSGFSFNNKELITNKYLKKIQNPLYSSEFIRSTYPPLIKFRYSGEHKPSEILFNKYYAAFVKSIRQIFRHKYPLNFPLGNWMYDFTEKNLPLCYDYPVLRETFNLDQLIQDLHSESHKPIESHWLKFTNPIMMRFIIEEFANG